MSLASRILRGIETVRRKVSPRRTDTMSSPSLLRDVLGPQRFVGVDVGAANGLLPHWELLNGVADVYQIEPRRDACEELQRMNRAAGLDGSRHVVCAGVAGTDGPRTLYVSRVPTGTSLLRFEAEAEADIGDYRNPHYLHPITEHTIETTRLSSLMSKSNERQVDLIKLDIQGAELEATRGLGPELLPGLLGAELEVGLHGLYPKDARFPAVEEFMNENGLELFDIRVARVRRPLRGTYGGYESEVFSVDSNSPTIAARVWEIDAIYFRKKSVLLARGSEAEIRRMAVVYATYNYYSEAYSLLEKAEHAGILDAKTTTSLKQAMVDLHHVRNYRPWLANTPFWRGVRSLGMRIAPRNAPRWCQHMYQQYPSG
jgi:FkbM family methyltransferase